MLDADRRAVLHLGTMKSGTTTIQGYLDAHRDVLADHGFLVLGGRTGAQFTAVTDVMQTGGRRGQWERLAEEARAWPRTSVMSTEFLGPLSPRRIRVVVEGLAAPTRAVLTVRDLGRAIPSQWQETIANGRDWSWGEYVAGVERGRPAKGLSREEMGETGHTFWRQQNAMRMVRQWGGVIGQEALTVVTLPPPGAPRDVLVRRFGAVLGHPLHELDPVGTRNESLGAVSAEMLRRVNLVLNADGRVTPVVHRVRKRLLAKESLAPRRREEPTIGMDVPPWLERTSRRLVERLAASPVSLEGEWADLDPVPVEGVDPDALADADLLVAARAGYDGLLAQADDAERLREQVPWVGDDVDAAARVLAELVRRLAAVDAA